MDLEKNVFSTRVMVYVAVLGALSTLIMFFEFPVLPMAPFLKVDFSDVVTIIGGITFGPMAGAGIAFVRSLVNWLIKGAGLLGLIGNFAGFIGSLAIMMPLVLIKNRNMLIKIVVSIISLTVISSLVNYFFLMPTYMSLAGMNVGPLGKYVLTIVIPFNLIKGTLITIVSWLIYTRMKGYLSRIKK